MSLGDASRMAHQQRDPVAEHTKKQTTRLLRVVCPNCRSVLRATRQFLAAGRPTCPCGYAMQVDDHNPLAACFRVPGELEE